MFFLNIILKFSQTIRSKRMAIIFSLIIATIMLIIRITPLIPMINMIISMKKIITSSIIGKAMIIIIIVSITTTLIITIIP